MTWRQLSLNTLYVAVATASLAILQWLIMAMVGHREGPVALGEYALSLAIATPASYLAWLSLRQQLLVSAIGTSAISDYAFLRFYFPCLVFVPVWIAAV